MEEEKELPINSMFRHPEIAKEVGFLMIYAANLEIWMFAAFSVLMKNKNALSDAVLTNVDNLSAKTAIVYSVAALREGVSSADEILQTKEQTLKAIAFRNQLAHGNFGINPEGKLVLTFGVTNPNRSKPKTITLTTDKIRAHTEALRSTIMVIRKHFGSDVFVFHQGAVDGVPSVQPAKPVQASQESKSHRKGRQSLKLRKPRVSSPEKE